MTTKSFPHIQQLLAYLEQSEIAESTKYVHLRSFSDFKKSLEDLDIGEYRYKNISCSHSVSIGINGGPMNTSQLELSFHKLLI